MVIDLCGSISNFLSFLKLYFTGRCWTTNGSIQNRMNSSPSATWRMENSTVRLETQWTSHLASEGGEHYVTSQCLFVFCPSHRRSCRICPGRHLAHSIVTLAAASVLSTFDLVRKVDKNGQEIEPKREYSTAGIRWVRFSVLDLSAFKCHL